VIKAIACLLVLLPLAAPKYRSPACRDAEIFIRQNC